MDKLRKPFLVLAIILIAAAVMLELGSLGFVGNTVAPYASSITQGACMNQGLQNDLSGIGWFVSPSLVKEVKAELAACSAEATQAMNHAAQQEPPPGRGLPYLALLDGLLLFTTALIGGGLIYSERVQGRIQGMATMVFSIVLVLTAVGLLVSALLFVVTLVSLLLDVPVGTLTYIVEYGFFNRGGARTVLLILALLRLGFAASLLVAQRQFLQNKGLLLLWITAMLATLIVGLLQGVVPLLLVSITDAIAAIIVALLALIWAIVFLIRSVPAVLRAIRPVPA